MLQVYAPPAKLLPLLQCKQLQNSHGHQAVLLCFILCYLNGTVQVPDAKSVGNSLPQATSGRLAWLGFLSIWQLFTSSVSHLITTPKLMALNIHSGLWISLDMILFNFICAYAKLDRNSLRHLINNSGMNFLKPKGYLLTTARCELSV